MPRIDIPKDWCIKMAKLEGDSEIGAGLLARDPVLTNDALIDSVANAHVGVPMNERHALTLLVALGMDSGEAEELLADVRHEASKE
jgi:hypothetical protein